MRNTMRAAAVAGVLLLTAACGGGGGDDAEAGATTVPETTTTTVKIATVEQVAAVVAQHDVDLLASMDEAKPCTILIFPEDCFLAPRLAIMSAGLQASTLEITLGAIDEDRPNNRLYVGAVPAELEELVDETLTAARAVKAAAEDTWSGACGEDVTTPECSQAGLVVDRAFSDMEDVLNSWRPYL